MKTSILLILILVLFISCVESYTSYYSDLNAAEKAGAVEKGWIPKILPKSSKEILEEHNLDTNEVWLKFRASRKDLLVLMEQLRTLNEIEISKAFPNRYPKKWWLPSDSTQKIYSILAYDFKIKFSNDNYVSKNGYFFIDIKNLIGFYFSN